MSMQRKTTRDAFGDEIVRLGQNDRNIYVVDIDIGKSCKTGTFKSQLPGQYVNVGIAEQNASTMSIMDERLLVGTIPWIFDDYQHARRIIDSTGGDHYRRVLREQGFVYLASCHNGFRQITNSRREIKSPEDVAGLKIRVPGGEIFIRTFKVFGGDPVAMSWSEAFTAIQQGTIDGQENGFSVTNSAKVNEIQKYMTVWNYTYENYLFVANEAIFERFSPETRQLLQEKALEACEWGRQLVEREEKEIEDKFVALGMKVTHLTPEQLAAFKAVVADLQGSPEQIRRRSL